MSAAAPFRPSHRAGARIAIAGAAPRSSAVAALRRAELDDVRFVEATGDESSELGDTDMLVFIAAADDVVDPAATRRIASAARERGILIAGVVTGVPPDDASAPSALLATLRDAADLVMVVREPSDVRAIVAALR